MKKLIDGYYKKVIINSQRIFTALDRDPDSPTYGSFDRDYWHYKIRDFSSMVLHQAALTVEELYSWSNSNNIFHNKAILNDWVNASLNHWLKSQLKDGSFNEYYPFEHGYPPTAFSLYATVLLVHEKRAADKKMLAGIENACKWILSNPEKQASNQEAIGLSAVFTASLIKGVVVDMAALNKRLNEFFSSQDSNGWFPEYGGSDVGYLCVTLDALWDYYRFSGDKRAYSAMVKAAEFISLFIPEKGHLPTMINARNTDYFLPYGLFNICVKEKSLNSLLIKLLKKIDEPYCYLDTTDDRYLCHYVFTSFVRALPVLEQLDERFHTDTPEHQDTPHGDINMASCGIFIKHTPEHTIYINSKKGGVLYLYSREKGLVYTNQGYRYKGNKYIAVTNWLSDDFTYNISPKVIKVNGMVFKKKWLVPTPFKHIVLRVLSFMFGNKLIPILKKIFIFGDDKIDILFQREIYFKESETTIEDTFESNTDKFAISEIYQSPFYSLRHVSSAVRFTPEELLWKQNDGFSVEQETSGQKTKFVTRITMAQQSKGLE